MALGKMLYCPGWGAYSDPTFQGCCLPREPLSYPLQKQTLVFCQEGWQALDLGTLSLQLTFWGWPGHLLWSLLWRHWG